MVIELSDHILRTFLKSFFNFLIENSKWWNIFSKSIEYACVFLTHKTLTFRYSDYSVIAICMQYILCMLFFAFYAIDCPTLMYSANYFWFKSRSLKVFCFLQNSCFLQILKLRKKLLYLFLIEALVPFFLIHMDNRQNDLAKSESS